MSILKAKIRMVQKQRQEKLCHKSFNQDSQRNLEEVQENNSFYNTPLIFRNKILENINLSSPMSEASHKEKAVNLHDNHSPINIMKNYCRGITNFALSDLAIKYLVPLLKKHQLDLEAFRVFIRAKKPKINCIKQLRGLLLVKKDDREEMAAMKDIFREITIIFLKYFSPNWIYNTRIADKYAHLKYRFKVLRRVKNPIYFTYLQGFDHQSQSKP